MARKNKLGKQNGKKDDIFVIRLYRVVDRFREFSEKRSPVPTILIAVLLAGAAFAAEWFKIVPGVLPAALCFPAGVLLFSLIYQQVIKLRETQYADFIEDDPEDGEFPPGILFLKDRKSFKVRFRWAVIAFALVLAVTAGVFSVAPYSVGCLVAVVLSCGVAIFGIRTESEELLAMEGLPDPRDLNGEEEEEEDDEYLEEGEDDYYEDEDYEDDEELSSASQQLDEAFESILLDDDEDERRR